MPKRDDIPTERIESHPIPASTPEGRENILSSLAMKLAEERVRNGTASAQETVYLMKLGSAREKLEQTRLEHENLMMKTKIESMRKGMEMDMDTKDVLAALRRYNGDDPNPDADY